MRMQRNVFVSPRRIFNVFLPLLFGAVLTHVFYVYRESSNPTFLQEHLGLRRFQSAYEDQDVLDPSVKLASTKMPNNRILGDINQLFPTYSHSPVRQKVKYHKVRPKLSVQKFNAPVKFSEIRNVQSASTAPEHLGKASSVQQKLTFKLNPIGLPFVEWTSGEVLQHIAAYSPPSESELARELRELNGFDEKPPGHFVQGWKTPCWIGNSVYKKSKLKCLPAFYIPGFPKCATTDLWYRLKKHPQLRALAIRETNWWTQGRYRINETESLGKFSGMLGKSLERWGKAAPNLLLAEGSPSNMWMAHNEIRLSENTTDEPLAAPRVLTPHLIKTYTPRAKFIVIMRNPADRIFSHFCYYGNKTRNPGDYTFKRSPARFHRLVVQLIAMYQDCFARRSVRDCAYDPHLSRECNQFKIRIDRTLYPVFISDWMKVFSREQFLFVRTEDYRDKTATVLHEMFSFLKLDAISNKSLNFIATRRHMHTRELYSVPMAPMWNETRKLLDDFFRPFNGALATLLQDEAFLWKKETSWSATTQ
ncbi:carbohydrate sulfotransferase 15-like [Lineus longissimus]|uniref:carbohydrate sulfotransferase 15-like n=1 Tax=Lineus longissimus TaxID=88925 RepID=UPI002B4F88F5